MQQPIDPARSAIDKAIYRLAPFLCLLFIFNILDRTNVGFARLTMESDLGMSRWAYDFGFGIFYIGYLLFEVPANLLLQWIGARRWIARIMITWGMVSCATLFVTGPISFYIVRVMLGIAEAGFFPGIILYLTFWFPARERARVMSYFMMAIPLAGLLGNPLSGSIMQHLNEVGGLKGWQWLFLLEGIPSMILGVVVLFYLPDGPRDAGWLRAEERAALADRLRQEELAATQKQTHDFWPVLFEWRVWLLTLLYFTVATTANASGAYLPRLLDEHFAGLTKSELGWLSALPHLWAVLGMIMLAASSDYTGERRLHVAIAAAMAGIGWAIAMSTEPWTALGGLCLAQAGMMAMLPTFWPLPPMFLRGTAVAGGIALINSVGNLGGLVGPQLLGAYGPGSMAVIMVIGVILTLFIGTTPKSAKAKKRA